MPFRPAANTALATKSVLLPLREGLGDEFLFPALWIVATLFQAESTMRSQPIARLESLS